MRAGLRAPEDAQNKAATQEDKDAADRALRIVANDLENILCVPPLRRLRVSPPCVPAPLL